MDRKRICFSGTFDETENDTGKQIDLDDHKTEPNVRI
jgi:hypothetical protein